jgi:ferredoxin
MPDAIVKFEREGAEGFVAVGSYLGDAAKRLGVKFEPECSIEPVEHNCAVEIAEGGGLLTEKTSAEKEILKEASLGDNWRLACHAKIEEAGEVVVMTKEKPKVEDEADKDQAEDYRKRFEELPLEKKMAELVRLESIALSETLNFVVNSPYKVADKVMEFMAEFGFKLEKDKKEASKPEEHRSNGNGNVESAVTDSESETKDEDKKDEEGV